MINSKAKVVECCKCTRSVLNDIFNLSKVYKFGVRMEILLLVDWY